MTKTKTMTAATAVLMLLAGCGADAGTENNQQRVAAANEQKSADHNSMAMDPNNPYAQAEMQMHERMMAAQGQNAAETFVRKMIEHHRGGIAMSEVLIAQGGEPAVLEKARKTSADQQKEIQELERMLQGGVSGNSPANPYAEGEKKMHDLMMAATGANPSETWLRKMIEHHKGAVQMSQMVVEQGGNPQVAAVARKTADKQTKEIAELERMLAGGGTTAAAGTASPPETAAKAEPRETSPAPKAKAEAPRAAAKAEPKAAAKAEPKAAEKAPAASTCAPEHRAMGHC
ncbi:DUF305 domain-containing protein [Sphingomonas parva]|uniref:DUF305 domain-containing protein n=1 Tax=Sphingomonas parva TaxID=2555898 RepID=A0A4Y8ZTH7_9SPHN|nr:DUF305 domain-containing protein [Sphingomonas parva]TFI58445.1 DUF305 domain-containing protein [Sphingomonas parva]